MESPGDVSLNADFGVFDFLEVDFSPEDFLFFGVRVLSRSSDGWSASGFHAALLSSIFLSSGVTIAITEAVTTRGLPSVIIAATGLFKMDCFML